VADVLKEFLVKIGYHVDKESQHKFFENLGETVKRLGEVAAKVEVTAGLMAAAFVKMGESVEKTYFTASRAGASVAGLEAFRFAAGRLGITAEEAVGSLTTLGNRLKDYPALRASIERRAGVAGLGHNVDQLILTDIPNILRGMAERGPMGEATARNYARDILGVSPNFVDAVKNREEWEKQVATYQKISRTGGRDPNDVKGWLEFMDQVAQLDVRFTSIKNALGTALSKNLVPLLKDFGDYMDKHGDEIAKTVSDIATALTEMALAIAKAIVQLDVWLGGSEGWTKAFTAVARVVLGGMVPGLWGMVGALTALAGIAMPGWLLAMLGLSVYGAQRGGALLPATEGTAAEKFLHNLDPSLGPGESFGERFARVKQKIGGWFGGGASVGDGNAAIPNMGKKGWWTPDRIKHATNRLVNEFGFSQYGAAGAVARMMLEAPGGPSTMNSTGHFGIAQWSRSRQVGIEGNTDFDAQLTHYGREQTPGTPEYSRAGSQRSAPMFRSASNPALGSLAASMNERAERSDPVTGADILTAKTPTARVHKMAFGEGGGGPPALAFTVPGREGVAAQPRVFDLPLRPDDMTRTIQGGDTTDSSKSLTVNQNVTNNVNGAKDPKATGEEVASKMGRPIADVQSNFFSGAQ
jgi:hypothetical protein